MYGRERINICTETIGLSSGQGLIVTHWKLVTFTFLPHSTPPPLPSLSLPPFLPPSPPLPSSLHLSLSLFQPSLISPPPDLLLLIISKYILDAPGGDTGLCVGEEDLGVAVPFPPARRQLEREREEEGREREEGGGRERNLHELIKDGEKTGREGKTVPLPSQSLLQKNGCYSNHQTRRTEERCLPD